MYQQREQIINKIKLSLLLGLLLGCLFSTTVAEAASLAASPGTGVYTAGGTFSVSVLVNTKGKSINAAEGTIKFDSQQLSVVRVSKGPIFGLWTVEPTYSNSAGTVTFGGGSPAGYKGNAGTVLTITFRARAAGTAKVSFSDGSVLAADGLGTNVLTAMNGGTYTLTAAEVVPEPEVIEYIAPANTPAAPVIASDTHSDPESWYQDNTARLSWTLPADVTAVRTLLDNNSGSIPTKVYGTPINSITLEDLEEGEQYFHLQFQNHEGWGRVAHYRLAIDSTPPAKFIIEPVEKADYSNPSQTFKLVVEDSGSGIAYYGVQIDNGEPYQYSDETGSSTITLPELPPGQHSVIIEAFDQADNSLIATKSFTILSFDKPQFTDYPTEVSDEVIPVIKGVTRPNAEVVVTLGRVGSEPATYRVESDDDGIFIFIPEGRLSEGVYELRAVATDQYGAKSELSESIRIAVQKPGFIRLGSLVVSVLSVMVPLVALTLLLILAIVYFISRIQRIRRTVTRETKDALNKLNEEFTKLKKALTAEETKLKKSRKTKKLTKAEAALITNMQETLRTAQQRLEKEVAEVDDIVE